MKLFIKMQTSAAQKVSLKNRIKIIYLDSKLCVVPFTIFFTPIASKISLKLSTFWGFLIDACLKKNENDKFQQCCSCPNANY